MKKLRIVLYTLLMASFVFSAMNFSLSADISLAAFALGLVFCAVCIYVGYVRVVRRGEAAGAAVLRRLCQYLPFVYLIVFVLRRAGRHGTGYAFDVVSVVLWAVLAVCAAAVCWLLNPKRVCRVIPEWKEYEAALTASRQRRSAVKRVLFEALEWIDAFVQAAFTVLLINIFILQLYEIPSESMVPEFLVRDRVAVFKTVSGPRFPLASVGIPRMRGYDRGDIIVFRNPHYSRDRQSEVRNFVSQLVYMLTFTGVNLNTTEDGELKADPLVKRITGVPGEQLMMQDGVLYVRTASDPVFRPVDEDARWAEWNVGGLSGDMLQHVQDVPVPQTEYDDMIALEAERNALVYADARRYADELARRFEAVSGPAEDAASAETELFGANDFLIFNFSSRLNSMTLTLLSSGASAYFRSFMTGWTAAVPEACFGGAYDVSAADEERLVGGNLYDDASFRLNLLIKLAAGTVIVRNAELMRDHVSSSLWNLDAERQKALELLARCYNYLSLHDRRNMPVFPANENGAPSYIPSGEYFMMGDNRFNSLDMRHSYDMRIAPLTAYDAYSVRYYSNMAPQTVPAEDILGTAVLRIFPFSRFGIPGVTGKR